MNVRTIIASLGAAGCALGIATPASASPSRNHSPNQEQAFPVVCNGVSYTLYDVPASGDHAEFTPAFVSGTNKVIVPFVFDSTQTATALTDGTVFGGVTYNAGDIIFSGTEASSVGAQRPGGQTCTFSGEGTDTFTDDNGKVVQVHFSYSGVAQAIFPNSR